MSVFGKIKDLLNEIRYDHSLVEELKFIKSRRDLIYYLYKVKLRFPNLSGNLLKTTDVPPSLQIEPTNVCNLRCTCCSIERSSRPKGYMDIGLFKKIMDDAADSGIRIIHLYLHGEPLLHPKIAEMVSYVKSKGMALRIVTNGSRLVAKQNAELLTSGFNSADVIDVSVLGFSKETHETIMRHVKHEEVVDNILSFLEYRAKHNINGPVIRTLFYKMSGNEHETEQYLKFWQGKVDHATILNRISKTFSSYKKDEKITIVRTKPCNLLWERMPVFWNGDVPLCCMDVDGKYLLGSLKNQSIREVWSCERLLSIKKIHKEKRINEFQFCYSCDLFQ